MPRLLRTVVSLLCLCLFTLPALAGVNPDWTTPLAPFQIADNLYYIGSRDLAAYLVTTPAGNILIPKPTNPAPDPRINAPLRA